MIRKLNSLQHPLVKHFVKLRQNHDYRLEHRSVIIDGIKPIREICTKSPAKILFAYDETFISPEVKAQEVFIVSESIMQKVSGMKSPEGVIAEVSMPEWNSLKDKRLLIVLDKINDPGNLGTILRTALALGWEGAFILNESCDPFNEKALRASRGAVFRLPMRLGSWEDLKSLIKENNFHPFVAGLNGKKLADVKINHHVMLILGNEAHGPSPEAMSLCQQVTIPMPGQMESLNVSIAGGILMYELHEKMRNIHES